MNRYASQWFGRVYAGPEEDAKAAADAAAKAAADAERKFTQDEVNKFLADDRRKSQEKLSTTLAELEKFKGTAKEKEALQQKVEELQKTFMTKEELAKQEQDKAKAKYENELSDTKKKAETWESLFIKNYASNEIVKAAEKHKAYSATQLEALLTNKVVVRPKTDELGNPTGAFEAVTTVNVKDKDGTEKPLEMTIVEAVGKMRELPEYGNLFLVDGKPGVGTTINNGSVPNTGNGPPPVDPSAYREWRKKQGLQGR